MKHEAIPISVGLPMHVPSDVTVYRADKVGGDIAKYNETIYTSFFNMKPGTCCRSG